MSQVNHSPTITGNVANDVRSGLVVFLVAVPLCLGIALASGAPLFSGIIAGIVGGIVVGSLSGSNLSVSGPAAGLTVIVLGAIEKLGQFETFLLAVTLAGVIQIGLGFARAGTISNFFPSAVIKGMLAAIGITLILKQIPHALGDDKDAEGEFVFFQLDGENTITEIINAVGDPAPGAIIISVVGLALLILWDRPKLKQNIFFKSVPGPLVVVIVGVCINLLLAAVAPQLTLEDTHLVQLPLAKDLSGFFNLFTLPDFTQFGNAQVYISAVTIAMVASLETLLNLEATDKLDPLKRNSPPNRELKAQGVGNLISGLIGGIPVTSVIVRSSVNVLSGGLTKLSAIVHGVLLLGCAILIPGILNLIPLAALSAILLHTGYKLAKIALFKEMFGLGIKQFVPFIITIVAVLFTDLLIGIGIGMAFGIFFILKDNYRTSHFFQKETQAGGERIKISLSEQVTFLNKASIINILENLPENSFVEIDGSQSEFIDYDVLEVIENFKATARRRNIQLTFNSRYSKFSNAIAQPPVHQNGHAHEVNKDVYNQLFENNRQWVAERLGVDPHYFEKLALGQQPKFLWIGCSDSRAPASEITGTSPGEMFEHRNVANLVISTDLNLLSVLQYAVEVLKVEHIIVCGHYGCGGVKAAMEDKDLGLINKWLRNIKDVIRLHRTELNSIPSQNERFKRLVELNVVEQVYNLYKTSIVQRAWSQHANLHVHGWVYDLREGLVKDLEIDIQVAFEEYGEVYQYGKYRQPAVTEEGKK